MARGQVQADVVLTGLGVQGGQAAKVRCEEADRVWEQGRNGSKVEPTAPTNT